VPRCALRRCGVTPVRERHRLAWQAALELLTGKAQEPTDEECDQANMAFVPLGTPLLAGPGAIVAAMLFVQRIHNGAQVAGFALALGAVIVLLWLAMRVDKG
jgi:multiple antibiotic resistance protein